MVGSLFIYISRALAATYDRDCFYHRDDVCHFVAKAAIQKSEHVLDLGTGTGWVAQVARCYSTGKIVGVDISPKMVEEARRQAVIHNGDILYLIGDMITLQGLDSIKEEEVEVVEKGRDEWLGVVEWMDEPFATHGDSGSLVFAREDGIHIPLGIHVGSLANMANRSIFISLETFCLAAEEEGLEPHFCY